MVAPVALPILGLLAAAGGQALMPTYRNYAEEKQRRYRSEVREGILSDVDTTDPNATGRALFMGGLLEPDVFQSDTRTAYEGTQDRFNALERQRIASGPGYMNAQLARDQWAVDPLNPESPTYGTMTPYQQATLDIQRQNADLGQSRLEMEREAMRLEQARLDAQLMEESVLAQQDFREAAQPLLDQQEQVDFAIRNLSGANFDRFLQSEEGYRTTQSINQLIFAQRQEYIRQTYGDREPPPSVQEEVARLFPMIEPGVRDTTRQQLIMDNLMRLKQDLGDRYRTMTSRMGAQGYPVPEMAPRNVLPEGWTRDGG